MFHYLTPGSVRPDDPALTMEYHLLSNELLARLLKVDDEQAFREIYERFWKTLFQTARFKLGSDTQAEELVQNVFMSLWEKRGAQNIDNLGGYLFNALQYQVIDHYRKKLHAEKYLEHSLRRISEEETADSETFGLSEVTRLFDEAMETLPEKTSRVFKLSRIEHKSTREIATLLDMPERTVEYHITQALKTLRHLLKDYLPLLIIGLGKLSQPEIFPRIFPS